MEVISFVGNKDIDRARWDEKVIEWSGQPYALSWWLDVVSPEWKCLVSGDYDAVMPLPVKQKWGLRYLVQPKLTQQLGVFGNMNVAQMIKNVPYLSYDINLNYKNEWEGNCRTHVNYVIDGSVRMSQNTRRNVAKSNVLDYISMDRSEFIRFWAEHSGHFVDPPLLNQLIDACVLRGMARIDGAMADGELVAALFSVVTTARIITLAPVSNAIGYQRRAMFGLMNNIIETRGERVVDCEGSMLEGVARFYRGFGATAQPYKRVWRLSPRRKY